VLDCRRLCLEGCQCCTQCRTSICHKPPAATSHTSKVRSDRFGSSRTFLVLVSTCSCPVSVRHARTVCFTRASFGRPRKRCGREIAHGTTPSSYSQAASLGGGTRASPIPRSSSRNCVLAGKGQPHRESTRVVFCNCVCVAPELTCVGLLGSQRAQRGRPPITLEEFKREHRDKIRRSKRE
jgi:hypothetical protein